MFSQENIGFLLKGCSTVFLQDQFVVKIIQDKIVQQYVKTGPNQEIAYRFLVTLSFSVHIVQRGDAGLNNKMKGSFKKRMLDMRKEMQDLVQQCFGCKPVHLGFLSAFGAILTGEFRSAVQTGMQGEKF